MSCQSTPTAMAPVQKTEELPETPLPTEANTPLPTMADATIIPTQINHLVQPGDPTYASDQRIRDCNTGERAAMGVDTLIGYGCDDWNISMVERPADSANGSYIAEQDIVFAQFGSDKNWIYSKLEVFGDLNDAINGWVAIELDFNLDGDGEIVILARIPNSSEWTVENVSIWEDTDDDVKGLDAIYPDQTGGNGYETLLFDSGLGSDPDLGWVRISPGSSSVVEIAIKAELVPDNKKFAWWTWISGYELEPMNMEIVDHLDDEATWNVDNTCGWIFNSKPSKMLPNICKFENSNATPTLDPTQRSKGNSCKPPAGGCFAAHGYGWDWDPDKCKCIEAN